MALLQPGFLAEEAICKVLEHFLVREDDVNAKQLLEEALDAENYAFAWLLLFFLKKRKVEGVLKSFHYPINGEHHVALRPARVPQILSVLPETVQSLGIGKGLWGGEIFRTLGSLFQEGALKRLRNLSLGGDGGTTSGGSVELRGLFSALPDSLETLELKGHHRVARETWLTLASRLSKWDSDLFLSKLTLRDVVIDDLGAAALFRALPRCLEVLNLRGVRCVKVLRGRLVGWGAFGDRVEKLKDDFALSELVLADCEPDEDALVRILRSLPRHMTSLKVEELRGVGDKAWSALASRLLEIEKNRGREREQQEQEMERQERSREENREPAEEEEEEESDDEEDDEDEDEDEEDDDEDEEEEDDQEGFLDTFEMCNCAITEETACRLLRSLPTRIRQLGLQRSFVHDDGVMELTPKVWEELGNLMRGGARREADQVDEEEKVQQQKEDQDQSPSSSSSFPSSFQNSSKKGQEAEIEAAPTPVPLSRAERADRRAQRALVVSSSSSSSSTNVPQGVPPSSSSSSAATPSSSKWSDLEILDLGGSPVGDQCAGRIVKALPECLDTLTLWKGRGDAFIEDIGFNELALKMTQGKLSNLGELDLSGQLLTCLQGAALCRFLPSSLHTLSLGDIAGADDPEEGEDWAQALAKRLREVPFENLSDIQLGPMFHEDGDVAASLFSALPESLESLQLSIYQKHGQIQDHAWKALTDKMKSGGLPKLRSLCMIESKLASEASVEVIRVLPSCMDSLTLGGNGCISPQAWQALTEKFVRKELPELTSLELSGEDNPGVEGLLCAVPSHIERLALEDGLLEDLGEDLVSDGKFLSFGTTWRKNLRVLDLGYSGMDTGVAVEIFRQLPWSLEGIRLTGLTEVEGGGWEALAVSFKSLVCLSWAVISYCQLSTESAVRLVSSVPRRIERLDLRGNPELGAAVWERLSERVTRRELGLLRELNVLETAIPRSEVIERFPGLSDVRIKK